MWFRFRVPRRDLDPEPATLSITDRHRQAMLFVRGPTIWSVAISDAASNRGSSRTISKNSPSPLCGFGGAGSDRACLAEAARRPRRRTIEYPANGSSHRHAARGKRIYGQAARLISTSQLNASLRFHTWPINLVVYQEPSEGLLPGISHLVEGFTLRCLQRFSLPDVATRRCRWRDNRYTRGPSNPVLSY